MPEYEILNLIIPHRLLFVSENTEEMENGNYD